MSYIRKVKMNPKRKKKHFQFYRDQRVMEKPKVDPGVPQMAYQGWSGREAPVNAVLTDLFDTVIITAIGEQYPGCDTGEECIKVWKDLEQHYVTHKKVKTTPYSFLVGNDGMLYEARGFMQPPLRAQEQPGLGKAVLDIAVTGSYADPEKSLKSIELVKEFMSQSQSVGIIEKTASLRYCEEKTNTLSEEPPPHIMAILSRPKKKTAFN